MPRSIAQRMGTAGALLQRARHTRGWTVREVEARTGISHGYVGSLETGARKTRPEVLRQLTTLYELPLAELLVRGALERGRGLLCAFLAADAPHLCAPGYRLAIQRPDGTTLGWQDLGTGALALDARPDELLPAPGDVPERAPW